MKIVAILVGLLAQIGHPGQYNIAVGRDANFSGSYDVVIGDGLFVEGECQIKIGTLGAASKRYLRALKKRPTDRLVFATAATIEQHCGYQRGYIDLLMNYALDDQPDPRLRGTIVEGK